MNSLYYSSPYVGLNRIKKIISICRKNTFSLLIIYRMLEMDTRLDRLGYCLKPVESNRVVLPFGRAKTK